MPSAGVGPVTGRFIVLEGGEGVGKTTQAALLSAWLTEVGIEHVLTREPGGTPVGEVIRELVLGRKDLEMPPQTELFLILAARAAFVRDVVRPALEAGKVVLADRFALSTLAYQGYGRGLDLDEVRKAIDLATEGLVPDLCVILDLPAEEGARRQLKEGKDRDRIEAEGVGFMERVRSAYLELATSEPRIRTVSAAGPAEEVHRRVLAALQAAFPETFGGEVV